MAMKNDDTLGLFPSDKLKQTLYAYAHNAIGAERDLELRAQMMAEFRALRVANFRFGMLLRKHRVRVLEAGLANEKFLAGQ
jgi:hypothetical protein